jgi:DUF438 domain-containing protein
MSEQTNARAQRVLALKRIIRHLHQGAPPESVKQELTEIVRQTDAGDIAAMEQELMAEGMSAEEITSMCDLHSQILRDIMAQPPAPPLPPGHPVDTFRRENEAVKEAVAGMRAAMVEIGEQTNATQLGDDLLRLRGIHNELMDVEKHYARKENLLFACLERHGVTGPPKVMWAKDDEIRDMLRAVGRALGEGDVSPVGVRAAFTNVVAPVLDAIEEMIHKEDSILLPMALETLGEEEWGEIWRQSPEYGWCLVDPQEGYRPPESAATRAPESAEGGLLFPTGVLSFEQVQGILDTLPVELTFVDADDRVRYFSHGSSPIFARSKAIIGRKVQFCHPPKSLDIVQKVLDSFRTGRHSVAEAWMQRDVKFIHIRYFAVRDPNGRYIGTLEVTQELTRLRSLQGDQRTLVFDSQSIPRLT